MERPFHRQHVVAGGDAQLGEAVALPDQQLRHSGGPVQEPKYHARPCGHRGLCRQPAVEEGLDHGQVPLQADAGDGLGRAVHVAVKHGGHEAAGGLAERPAVAAEVVVDAQRQREQKQQVRQGQIEVQGRRREGLGPEPQERQDVGVGRDSDQHGQDVAQRYDPGAEDPRGVARHRIVRINL